MRKEKNASRVIQLSKEWSANSSLHGVKYVGEDATHILEKIMWLILVCAATGFALYLCWSYWHKWEVSPVLTYIDSHAVALDEIPFPAFTICNVNKVSKRRLTELLTNPRYSAISYDDMKLALRIMTKPDLALPFKFRDETLRLATLMKQNNINVSELLYIMKKTQTKCEELLVDCTWQENPVDCNEFFVGRATDDGFCCSFNAENVRLYLAEVDTEFWDGFYDDTERNLTEQLPANIRDYDVTLNASSPSGEESEDLKANIPLADDKKIVDTSSPGSFAGLSIMIDGNYDDYGVVTSTFDGIKAMVHNRKEFPDVGERGFILGLGKAAYIGIEPISIVADDTVKSIKFEKRMCYYENEAQFDFSQRYSVSQCTMECLTRTIIQKFDCQPYFYPVTNQYVVWSNYPNSQFYLDEYCPDCHPECSELIYKAQLSYSTFPGVAFNGSSIYRRLRNSTHYNRQKMDDSTFLQYVAYYINTFLNDIAGICLMMAEKNMITVSLFFQNAAAMRYKMETRYGWEDFVSAMGGLLGLGLGFSVIACVEILYFMCFRWCFEREHRVRPGSSATLALQAALQSQPIFRPQAPNPAYQHQVAVPPPQESPKLRLRRRRYAEDALPTVPDTFYAPPIFQPNVIFQQVPLPVPVPSFQSVFVPQFMPYNPVFRK